MAKFVKLKLLNFLVFSQFLCKINKLISFIYGILMTGIRHALFFSKMININNMLCQSIFLFPVFFFYFYNLMHFATVFLSIIWDKSLQFYYFSYRMNTFYVDVISFFLISHIELETNKKKTANTHTYTHTRMRKPLKKVWDKKIFW